MGSPKDIPAYADKPIPAGTEMLEISDAGTTKRAFAQAIANLFGSKNADVVAAATTDLSATAPFLHVTGSGGPITSLGNVTAGRMRVVMFTGTPTLVHHGSNLILPTNANIVVQANDRAIFFSRGGGQWLCVAYQRASGDSLSTLDAVVYRGAIDCSANPNYPAANAGDLYYVSVAGKIGGAAGVVVEVGDSMICRVDGSAAGNQATVGANWNVFQTNITYVPEDTANKSNDTTMAADSAVLFPTQHAVKTYVDALRNEILGKHSIPVMAGAMRPSVAGGCAPLSAIASGANLPDILTMNFDAATEEYAQFAVPMPKSWNEGTLTALFRWSHAAAATYDVVWGIQAVAVSNDDTIAAAFGAAQTVTDSGGTTDDLYVTAETAAITVAGAPADADTVYFRVYRKSADGADTLNVDARLHSVVLFLTTNAGNDA